MGFYLDFKKISYILDWCLGVSPFLKGAKKSELKNFHFIRYIKCGLVLKRTLEPENRLYCEN